ncbi:MAG: D-alanyl-D-alanine carboxypeptidase [Lachnospiraceae bacterium]|nr:D-alanyl-D-alanine carboxypeptidase [Lachnospiraceae bacterium]
MAERFVDRETEAYEKRRMQRAARRADRARQQREREKRIKRYAVLTGGGVILTAVIVFVIFSVFMIRAYKDAASGKDTGAAGEASGTNGTGFNDTRESMIREAEAVSPAMTELSDEELEAIAEAEALAKTTGAGPLTLNTTPDESTESVISDVDSGYAILISLSENRVLAERQAHTRMYPASMTKVLTVLVAAERLGGEGHLDDIFTMTQAIEGFSYENGCSNVGFSVGERIRVEDLFYGTILPSGADAAMGLAEYIAGDQETFVGMMNEKLEELGISETTHFTNCIGIYDDNHYSTAADMAVIMNAAVNNPLCLKVLSEHTYTTTSTSYHPQGIQVSNWFLRRIEDKQETGIVMSGKTGFVKESLNCAVSYARDAEGRGYICCTGYAHGGWKAIYDHVRIYTHQFDPALYNATLVLENTSEETGNIEGGE